MTSYYKKGEWLELRGNELLPEEAQLQQYAQEKLGIPEKLTSKLTREKGIRSSGGRLLVKLFPNEESLFAPEWTELQILYEDDFCLVVNKPAGMSVHPNDRGIGGTLANVVAGYYASTGQQCAVRHIHRIDEDTTGPVLYAKNEYSQLILDEAMRKKEISRIYIAVVSGIPLKGKGRFDFPIGKDRHHNNRRRVSITGNPAVTHYEVAEKYNNAALVRAKLETGRTHQIRVHFSHAGHPLLGDRLYGGPVDRIQRQALHGEELRFRHPLDRHMVQVAAPLPSDLQSLIDGLRQP